MACFLSVIAVVEDLKIRQAAVNSSRPFSRILPDNSLQSFFFDLSKQFFKVNQKIADYISDCKKSSLSHQK